jgi:hypothetical protein
LVTIIGGDATDDPNRDKELADKSARLTNQLLLERQLRVADAARKALEEEGGRFQIRLKIPTGEKVTNPLGGEELIEYEEGKHETKTYYFHKITANDWNLYNAKRAELNNETAKPVGEADNAKIADLNNRIYEYLAIKYLGMKHDEYLRAEWDDVRLAVDACNHITDWQSQEVAVQGSTIGLIKKPQRATQEMLEQVRAMDAEEEEPTREFSKIDKTPPPKKEKRSSPKKDFAYDEY